LAPWDRERALDVEIGEIATIGVRDDRDTVAKLLEHPGFFEDTHVTAVIRKKAGGGNHKDAIAAGGLT
jgi:hypothetical protein